MSERICIWISWHLPKELVKWCAIRVITHKCEGNPGDRNTHEVMKAWSQ